MVQIGPGPLKGQRSNYFMFIFVFLLSLVLIFPLCFLLSFLVFLCLIFFQSLCPWFKLVFVNLQFLLSGKGSAVVAPEEEEEEEEADQRVGGKLFRGNVSLLFHWCFILHSQKRPVWNWSCSCCSKISRFLYGVWSDCFYRNHWNPTHQRQVLQVSSTWGTTGWIRNIVETIRTDTGGFKRTCVESVSFSHVGEEAAGTIHTRFFLQHKQKSECLFPAQVEIHIGSGSESRLKQHFELSDVSTWTFDLWVCKWFKVWWVNIGFDWCEWRQVLLRPGPDPVSASWFWVLLHLHR